MNHGFGHNPTGLADAPGSEGTAEGLSRGDGKAVRRRRRKMFGAGLAAALAVTAFAGAAPVASGTQSGRMSTETVSNVAAGQLAKATVVNPDRSRSVTDLHRDSGRMTTDIHRVRFINSRDLLVARVKIARFRYGHIGMSFGIDVGARGGRGYSAKSLSHAATADGEVGRGWTKSFYKYRHIFTDASGQARRCRFSVTGHRDTDTIRVVVPQKCLGRSTKVARLQIYTSEPAEGAWADKIDGGYIRVVRG